MQADFVLYLRACFHSGLHIWWPDTLVYASRQSGPFEIFARSRSASYFARAQIVLGIGSKDELQTLVEGLQKSGNVPRWQFSSFSPAHLLGLAEIATKP
jgi:hypothetical protein